MIELKNWETQPPAEGIFINLYRDGTDHAVFCQVIHEGFFRGVQGSQVGKYPSPSNGDMWCEVPEPPGWKLAHQRERAEQLVQLIHKQKKSLEDLEEESRKLVEEMEGG